MRTIHCPVCGSAETVEIAANPRGAWPRWAATCTLCDRAWYFDD